MPEIEDEIPDIDSPHQDFPLITVCMMPHGYHLYRKKNGVGGYCYLMDHVGGGMVIWDTSLLCKEDLLIAIAEEIKREYNEKHPDKPIVEV